MKTLYTLVLAALTSCAYERPFVENDFRDKIPVTSNVIQVDYSFDSNGQNNGIQFYDKSTGKSYSLIRDMDTKSLSVERATQRVDSDDMPNIPSTPNLEKLSCNF